MADKQDAGNKAAEGYGKRPKWQWVVLYLVVGGILYFLVYWFVMKDSGGGGLYTY